MRFCLVMVLLAVVVPGCDNPSTPPGATAPPGSAPVTTPPVRTPPAATSPAPAPARITLHRTGGFAGVDQTVIVDATGWTFEGTQRGQLTAAQRDKLRTLSSNPALRAEATRGRMPRECADVFEYELTVDTLTIRYADCPPADTEQPVTLAIIDLLVDATPL